MKKKRTAARWTMLLAAGLLSGLLAGCGSSYGETTEASTASTDAAYYYTEETADYDAGDYDTTEYAAVEDSAEAAAGQNDSSWESLSKNASGTDADGGSESDGETAADTSSGQKLIKTVSMSMETREFDTLLDSINAKVKAVGGYAESSNVSGSSYGYDVTNRYAWLTLRIPVDALDEFVAGVGELGNVTSQTENVQDITLDYVDTESRKLALETEQTRLLELLEKAESVEDIITIESRLSEVRYELQSYTSTLRTYDNQVSYSTVNLDIYEVERETVTTKQTFFGRVQSAFLEKIYRAGENLSDFGVWFLSSLPFILVFVLVVFLVVKLVRRAVRRRRQKKGTVQTAPVMTAPDRFGTEETMENKEANTNE